MANRTFAVGDLHGGLDHLFRLLSCLPELDAEDTIVFIGDYVDRGPKSAQVIDYVMRLPAMTPAKVVALRGNHEDAWLRVVDEGWDEFVAPPLNGCLAAYRSFVNGPVPSEEDLPRADELMMIQTGAFFPDAVVGWFRDLPFWYEDDHAIYVHAGLPHRPGGGFLHPSEVNAPVCLLWGRDEDFFREYKGIEVRTGVRADAVDTGARTVAATVLADGTQASFSYERLMLALGAAPKVLPGVVVGSDRVRFVKTMEDARVMRGLLERGKVDTVGVVGAGFIGCEMAEAFGSMWGCSVKLIEAADQILPGMLDADMASVVQKELESKSVQVLLRSPITRIDEGDAVTIHVADGPITVDLAVVGVGVIPQAKLAVDAGIAVGSLGGIVVDEHMRTSAPDVYAAGDCVECRSAVTGKPTLAALGSLANRQGRVAADHMVGKASRFGPVAKS
ncbi:MAG: hypothetical protein CVU63_03270, partial [Deltaproteobacteria bacterium HGW-Deltaproteobacteria-20]